MYTISVRKELMFLYSRHLPIMVYTIYLLSLS